MNFLKTLKAGDLVYSFNEETQEVSEQVVEETVVHESNELVHISVGNETITATPEHPFYMPKKGFVKAIDLRAGDILWTVNGEYVIIDQIQHEVLEVSVKVYNFKVANNHTYFVGKSNIGVHNGNCPPILPNFKNVKITDMLSKKLEDVRIKYNASSGRNVAILEGEIDGNQHLLESVSGKVSFNSDGSNNKGNFTPANKLYYEYVGEQQINTRYFDTEYKMIDYIRSLYDADHSVSGKKLL